MDAPAPRLTRHAEDHYAEASWTSARLFKAETFGPVIVDPSCGFGRIVEQAAYSGYEAYGTDIVPRWEAGPVYAGVPEFVGSYSVSDFLERTWMYRPMPGRTPDAIVSNPPFREMGHKSDWRYLRLALNRAPKVALLMPTGWANGVRTSTFLETTPLYREYRLGPRTSMWHGSHILGGGAETSEGKADYSWFIWLRGYSGAPTVHFLRR